MMLQRSSAYAVTSVRRGKAKVGLSGGNGVRSAQERYGLARELRVVGDAVEVDAHFEIVTTVPVLGREKHIGEDLPAGCGRFVVQIEVAACGLGVHEVGCGAVGDQLRVVLVESESGFEEKTSGKIMLVLDTRDPGRLNVFRIRLLRALRREECVLVLQMIDQKARREDVSAGDVSLELGEIADAQRAIVVLADG